MFVFFSFFSCRKLFVFEQQLLFRVDSLCDLGFSALGWGNHHALITRVDKPSLAQVRPYPTLVLPYPTPNPSLPYPTLPYPTQPYPTLPYPTLSPTLPYPTLPYTVPYPIPYPTLPYPYPTLYPLFVFEQQLLFRVDSLCDLGFSALGWGKHHALITRVDKPSLAQVRPYPTLVLPYPTLPYPNPTLPYPTLPYPTLPPTLPYPIPYPLPCPALPCPAPPHPAPPHPHPTLPYPTLPTWQAFLLKGNLI